MQDSWYKESLVCPDCRGRLSFGTEIRCGSCEYRIVATNTIELKPQAPRSVTAIHSRLLPVSASQALEAIEVTRPTITYRGPSAMRDSRELMSEISRLLASGSTVLDLGCGPRDQAVPVEYLGHKYVGVDYSNVNADFLADAHAIPFGDLTFDCVLSYAVLEHLHNPYVAMQEIARVLKPGGIYIGTVSQGEPFHGSYFHLTAWGLVSLASSIEAMELERLWASGDTLGSLARMGRYPRVIKHLLNVVHIIHVNVRVLAPRKMKWPERDQMIDELHRAGSICFVFRKI